VIFSQWAAFLDLIGEMLDEEKIAYVRIDGSVSRKKRQEVIDGFQNHPDIRVILITLKAGGVGLNLTAANYVILTDPWWAPAAEDQACDRVHRLGQSKPVTIIRLITKGTIEERVLALQDKKRKLIAGVFGELVQSKAKDSEHRLQDLMELFGSDRSDAFSVSGGGDGRSDDDGDDF